MPFLLRFVTEKSYSKKPNVVCDTTTVRETCGSQRQAINYRLVSWCNAYDKSKHRTCCMPLGSRCSVPSLTTSESYVRIARFPGLRKVRAQRHFRLETRDSIINVKMGNLPQKGNHISVLQKFPAPALGLNPFRSVPTSGALYLDQSTTPETRCSLSYAP